MYKHANGPPSRLARIAGDKRCSKEPTRRDLGAQAPEGLARSQDRARSPLLSSFGLRVSHVLRAHLKGAARGSKALGLWGSALEAERRGITRSSLRRIELESSLHPKEEEPSSVKSASCVATTARQSLAAGEDSARGSRARVSYFENSLQKSRGCVRPREASASIRQADVNGGLAETTALANAARNRSGEVA